VERKTTTRQNDYKKRFHETDFKEKTDSGIQTSLNSDESVIQYTYNIDY